jgi:ATP-dependent helicase/DNAse subunit B
LFHDLYGAGESFRQLPAEEQYAAAVVESSLAGLATLDAFEPRADLQSLTEVLALGFESALPRVGRFGEGVFVGPLSAVIGMDLDRVYVVGLAEDGYPGRLHEDALLPDELREVTDGELMSARERLDAKHRHLLAAFASAAHVTASFPRGDLRRSTARLPSRWLLDTLRALTGDPELAATDWESGEEHLVSSASYATSVTSTDRPAHEQEWRVLAATAGRELDDDVVNAAQALAQARASDSFTRYDGNLRGAPDLPDYAHQDRVISPTSLETYARCPHRYFVEKMLRIEPIEQPEEIITISSMDIGNLIHTCMDELIAEAKRDHTLPSYGEPWTDAQRRRLAEIAAAQAKNFADRGVTGHPLLWQREEAQVVVELDRMLDDDNAWRAERQARVVGSELEFGRNGVNPVVIAVADGEVRMLGSVDKVDETRDGVMLVTDIKSGNAKPFTVLEKDRVAAGTKLQLPVYAYAARQLLGGKHVEAAYWFVRKDAGRRIKITLDDELEQLYADTLGTLVSSIAAGRFPPKPSDQPSYLWVDCPYCDPDGRGHGDLRQQYERKRLDPALHELIDLVDAHALSTDAPVEGSPT